MLVTITLKDSQICQKNSKKKIIFLKRQINRLIVNLLGSEYL
jgi:hypothetical protein